MRTERSFQMPGIVAAASLAGGLLLSGCSSKGLMVYQNTKHVSNKNGITSGKGSIFSLKNGGQLKTTKHSGTKVKIAKIKPLKNRTEKTPGNFQPKNKTYIIQKGDTLSQIALDHKVGIDELASFNGISKDDMIRAGQKLKLPYGAVVSGRATTQSSPKKTSGIDYYTVQKGDFLGKIALKTKTSIADLRKWNNLKSDKIHIGWKLALGPGGKPEIKQPSFSSTRATKEIPADGVHTVKSGESISSIATMYKGVTSSKLKAINGLSSNRIMPGQTLKLRGDIQEPTEPTTAYSEPVDTLEPASPTDPDVNPVTETSVPPLTLPHFVDQQNDTLQSVADMYGSKIEWIQAKNPGIKTDSDLRGTKEINVPVQE